MKLRPSALPVIMRCSAAASLPAVEEDRTEAMTAGLLRHEKMAERPELAVKAFEMAGYTVPLASIAVEVPLSMPEMSGTADVVGDVDNGKPVVLDWKGPWDESDPYDQVQGYMHMAGAKMAVVAHVNDALDILSVEGIPYDEGWYAGLQRQLAKPPEYVIGDHCNRCTSFRLCPAQVGLVKEIVHVGTEAITREKAGEAWVKVKQYEAALSVAKDTLRAMAIEQPIPLPNGKVLASEEETKESILPIKAMALMPELESKVKMSLPKNAVTQKQLVQLRVGGCISTSRHMVVRERDA